MKNKLDEFAQIYKSEDGNINKDINSTNVVELVKRKGLVGGNAIQLGLGDGFVAEELATYYNSFVVIEGSKEVIKSNHKVGSTYEVKLSLFEEYVPVNKVDYVLGNHVLEHVDDPIQVLNVVRHWLKPEGRAIFTVPNSTSLHRRIGVEMGMIKVLNEFNKQDIELGHQRVYNIYQFEQDIRSAGFEILESSGYMVKLVSNQQMKSWSKELLDAIFKVSMSLPTEICSNLCVICKP